MFFFQAEDGIRDRNVTEVQTCALPISVPVVALTNRPLCVLPSLRTRVSAAQAQQTKINAPKIGRASCRERLQILGGGLRNDQKPLLSRRSRWPWTTACTPHAVSNW